MLMCTGGIFVDSAAEWFFTNAYRVFVPLPHMKECPSQHEVLLHNETCTFVRLHPLCI